MKKMLSALGCLGIAASGVMVAASPSQAYSDSWSTHKYLSLTGLASNTCGYLSQSGSISYPLIGRTTVKGKGYVRTYRCSDRVGKSLKRTSMNNVFKWYGPSVTSCSVGGSGGSCSLGIGTVTWKSTTLGGTASSYANYFTIYGGTFAVRVNHTTNGYWATSTRSNNDTVSSSRWL